MADNLDSLENILSCQICQTDFRESGNHVPRLLPCTHTLCEGCLEFSLRGKTEVVCPECRKKHRAQNGVRSFPINKYLLISIKRKETKVQEETSSIEKCQEHGKKLTLFCKEEECQKKICPVCLTKKHRKHDIVDAEEEQKEVLAKSLGEIISDLQMKKLKFAAAKAELEKHNENCMTNIKAERQKSIKKINEFFDKLMKNASGINEKANITLNNEMEVIERSLVLLTGIKQKTDQGTIAPEDVTTYLKDVTEVSQNLAQKFSATRKYKYPEYKEGRKLVQRDIQVDLTAEQTDSAPLATEIQENPAAITNASQLKCKGNTCNTLLYPITYFSFKYNLVFPK